MISYPNDDSVVFKKPNITVTEDSDITKFPLSHTEVNGRLAYSGHTLLKSFK